MLAFRAALAIGATMNAPNANPLEGPGAEPRPRVDALVPCQRQDPARSDNAPCVAKAVPALMLLMILQATTVSSGITIVVTWHLNERGSTLTGTVTQIWTSDTLSGQVNVTGTITAAVKS